ncbi:MAG: hypothetical protein L0I76_23620 [Pseudonocardia sp.]|nr:hypothetical protein [Pseudonocardia sp.]
MAQPVLHFEGRDGAKLRSFYSQLFDWTIHIDADNPAEYGLIQQNPDGVGIGGPVSTVPAQPSSTWKGPRRDQGYAGHVTVFVEVPDVEAALAQAEALGGARMQGPDPLMPGAEFGKFTDPEGHLIGVVLTAPC